jgi:hypothetical protein
MGVRVSPRPWRYWFIATSVQVAMAPNVRAAMKSRAKGTTSSCTPSRRRAGTMLRPRRNSRTPAVAPMRIPDLAYEEASAARPSPTMYAVRTFTPRSVPLTTAKPR